MNPQPQASAVPLQAARRTDTDMPAVPLPNDKLDAHDTEAHRFWRQLEVPHHIQTCAWNSDAVALFNGLGPETQRDLLAASCEIAAALAGGRAVVTAAILREQLSDPANFYRSSFSVLASGEQCSCGRDAACGALPDALVSATVNRLERWEIERERLAATFELKEYLRGLDFSRHLALYAEESWHNHDFAVHWNDGAALVDVVTWTRHVGGTHITVQDFCLALYANRIFGAMNGDGDSKNGSEALRLTAASKIPDSAHEQRFTGAIGASFDQLSKRDTKDSKVQRMLGELFCSFRTGQAVSAVELGCGTGGTTQFFLRGDSTIGRGHPNVHLLAVDNSAAMIEKITANLAPLIEAGRLTVVQNDALSALRALPANSKDIVAAAFTLHNFFQEYRFDTLAEAHRVLKPGGMLLIGDKIALDDPEAHINALIEQDRKFSELNGDNLKAAAEWREHNFRDESPLRRMQEAPLLTILTSLGFSNLQIVLREHYEAVLVALKP